MEGNKITYHQQVSFCGKARCRRCREGIGHGPYWYAYQTVNGRTVRTYIGKEAPAEVLAAQAETSAVSQEFANTVLRLYVLGQFRLEQRGESSPTQDISSLQPTRATRVTDITESAHSTSGSLQINGNARAKTSVANVASATQQANARAKANAISPPTTSIQWETVTDASLQHQRVRSLLSCLVSSPGRKLAREQVMYTLWPDLDMETASHRLDRAVHSLRQAFEPGRSRPATSKILLTEHSTLALADQAQFWVDADAFENLLTRARSVQESDPGMAEQLLEEAMQLYNGDFLPDENAIDWVQSRRESLRRAWISLLLELADLRIAREAIPGAIDILDRLLTVDSANEAAVQRLVALLAQMGRRGEAIQAYQRFASVLKQDYKIAPLPETRALYENVLHGRATLAPTNGATRGKTSANDTQPADIAPSSASLPAVLPSHMHIGRPQQSPLVGRDEEIARLHQLLNITQQMRSLKLAGQKKSTVLTPMDLNVPRRQQCVMLMGDVGIGKTRLAEEAAREAKRRNWAVAWCRAYTQESSVPYRLWTETLRKAMSQGLWQRQEVTRRPLVYQPLRSLLPELADLLPPALLTMPPPPEQEQLRLWESTRALLSTICENTTLLIVLDDLQWADSSSCELLTYLVRQMRGMPVMFLCTCRDSELPSNHPLRGLLTDLQREQAVEQIPVKPLSDTEISQLIGHLPEPVVKSVSSRASGNPFFAEELARGITTNAIDVTFDPANPEQLPDTIQAVLELRLGRISQECQRLLERGSVLGGAFLFDTIRDMASGGALADEDLILDLIEESLQAGMLTEEGSGQRITYHFWHPLLLTYLYERLSAARRASLHRKAAQVLQTLYAGNEAEGAAEIADHLVKGGSTPALTARYSELAADRAYSLSAYPDAEKYYRLALAHSGTLTPASPQEDRLHHAYILERLGESTMILGKYEDAHKFYENVLTVRSEQILNSEEEKQHEAQIEALIWCEIGQIWRYLGNKVKARESFERGENLLVKAKIEGGSAWARIRYQQGHTLWVLEGNLTEALAMAREALILVETILVQQKIINDYSHLTLTQRILNGDAMNLGRIYLLLGTIEGVSGKNTESIQHLNTALNIFEKYDYQREIAIVCSNIGDIYLRKAEYNSAQAVFHRALNIDEKIGDTPNMSVVLNNLGVLATRLGNLVEAENQYQQALALTEQVNDLFYVSLFSSYAATALIEQGKLEESKPLLIRALKISRSQHITPCIGFALVALGHLRLSHALASKIQADEALNIHKKRAQKRFEHLLRRAQITLQRALTFESLETDIVLNGQLLLARIALLSGETEKAHDIASKTLDEAITNDLVWLQAGAQRLLAQARMALGQQSSAEKLFQQALATFESTNMCLEQARTLQAYYTSLLEYSQNQIIREKAIKDLQATAQTFQDCQAILDRQSLEYFLSSLNAQTVPVTPNTRKSNRRAQ